MIEDTIVTINPFRDIIADLLMKEWKEKNQKLQAGKSGMSGSAGELKWTSYSGLKKQEEVKKDGVDQIGKYMKH